jgi:hypothetical protein
MHNMGGSSDNMELLMVSLPVQPKTHWPVNVFRTYDLPVAETDEATGEFHDSLT